MVSSSSLYNHRRFIIHHLDHLQVRHKPSPPSFRFRWMQHLLHSPPTGRPRSHPDSGCGCPGNKHTSRSASRPQIFDNSLPSHRNAHPSTSPDQLTVVVAGSPDILLRTVCCQAAWSVVHHYIFREDHFKVGAWFDIQRLRVVRVLPHLSVAVTVLVSVPTPHSFRLPLYSTSVSGAQQLSVITQSSAVSSKQLCGFKVSTVRVVVFIQHQPQPAVDRLPARS